MDDKIENILKELEYKQYLYSISIIYKGFGTNHDIFKKIMPEYDIDLKKLVKNVNLESLKKDIIDINKRIENQYMSQFKPVCKDTYKFGYIDEYNQFIEVPDEEEIRIKEKKNVFSRANGLFTKNNKFNQ